MNPREETSVTLGKSDRAVQISGRKGRLSAREVPLRLGFCATPASLHNISYTKYLVGAIAVLISLAMTAAFAPGAFAAATSHGATKVHPASAGRMTFRAPSAAADAHLIEFLQKRFKIPEAGRIKLGPVEPAGIDGLLSRVIDVVTDQGRHVRVMVFTDAAEQRMVIGTLFDLNRNPWGKVDMNVVHLKDRPALGPADAPVTMVEFADFECPFCAHAFAIVETLANSTYKGKLRVIFKNYPLNVHPWAVRAAEGAECARLQNPAAFWDMARDLYTNQNEINMKNVNRRLDTYAHQLGLDLPSLHACMSAPSTLARIRQDQQDGRAVHVSSTPTFFINGIPVVGLPENKVFGFVIDHALEEAKRSASRH